ncbi:hypothetical protein D3C81_2178740 [compost metagenome]
MRKALEELLGLTISDVKLDTIYAGALGAAGFAQKSAQAGDTNEEYAFLKA